MPDANRRAICESCGEIVWALAVHYVQADGPGRCYACKKGQLLWNDPPPPATAAEKMRAALAASAEDGYSLERMTRGLEDGLGKQAQDFEETRDG